MKRLFSFIAIMVFSYCIFAADLGSWEYGDSNSFPGEAYVPVSVDSTDTLKCVIGFTKTDPRSSGSVGINQEITPSTDDVNLSISLSDGKASSSDNSLYLYYQIASGESLNISLYGEKELSSTETSNNTDTVKWAVKNAEDNTVYVDFGVDSGEEKGNGSGSAVILYKHRPKETSTAESGVTIGNTFGNAGAVELSINTESLWLKKSDVYKANLVLAVASAN